MSLKTRNKVDPAFNLSSLADIIFLLLIFFLLTSQLVSPSAIKVKRPSTKQTTTVKPVARVSVTASLEYYVDNEPVQLRNLAGVLRTKIGNEPDPVVILDMDKQVTIERLVELSDIADDLNLQLVLSADPKKQ